MNAPPASPRLSRAAAAFDLRGRRALVTGGTRGLGRAVVLALALAGADVVTCHRSDGPDAESLRWRLKDLSGDSDMVRADVTRPEDVRRLVEACRLRLGGLDIVVNNAGEADTTAFADLDGARWHRAVDANLTSAFLVTHGVLPLLSRRASVVTVGLRAAELGVPGGVHYAAAKAGLVGFSRSLAKELGPAGVRVNLVTPGPLHADAPVTPEDVAAVVLFLASDEAGFITGETFPVDGGIP